MNKLHCTFSEEKDIDITIKSITSKYTILYNKIFVLEPDSNSQFLITYNIDTFNSSGDIMENTILVHRKKESNTLYSINSLNALIKNLNNGILDKGYVIPWENYRNCALLSDTQNGYKKINTTLYKIFST